MSERGVTATAVLRLASAFAIAGVALTGLGVAGSLNAIHGGPALAIFAIVIALACFALAGYLFWGYGWLNKRPELISRAKQRDARRRPE